MLWCHEVLWDEKQRYFGQLHHLEHRLELLAKKRQDLIGVKSHPNTINWPKICLVLLVSHWNMAISKISFLGFPDLTGGRWYQVLDLFAQDLRRTDVVTFNCAVASCEEIRFTFWGSFCCGNSGLGQQTFFFFFSDFGDACLFMVLWHGCDWCNKERGETVLIRNFLHIFFCLRNRRRLRGDLCYVATLLRIGAFKVANCAGATAAVFRGLRVNLNRVCWIYKKQTNHRFKE